MTWVKKNCCGDRSFFNIDANIDVGLTFARDFVGPARDLVHEDRVWTIRHFHKYLDKHLPKAPDYGSFLGQSNKSKTNTVSL